MAYEQTFAMCKPGVLQRRIFGEIITRMERKGFQIRAVKMMMIPEELCRTHYAEHEGKEFYQPLLEYMTSAPVIAMVLAGENAISHLRLLCGATNVDKSLPGTIRGDYAALTRMNIIHASDSPESAERESKLFFRPEEIMEYDDATKRWIS